MLDRTGILLGEKDFLMLKAYLLAEGRGMELEHLLFEEFEPPDEVK